MARCGNAAEERYGAASASEKRSGSRPAAAVGKMRRSAAGSGRRWRAAEMQRKRDMARRARAKSEAGAVLPRRWARCAGAPPAAGEDGALRKCSGREIWRGERERKAKREPSCRGGGQDAQERRRQREKIPRCGSAERRVRFGHGRTVERMDEKREKVEGCMLGRTACGDCSRCGWNSAVAEKRKRAIRRSIQSEREQGAAGAQRKGAVQWRERDSRPSWS